MSNDFCIEWFCCSLLLSRYGWLCMHLHQYISISKTYAASVVLPYQQCHDYSSGVVYISLLLWISTCTCCVHPFLYMSARICHFDCLWAFKNRKPDPKKSLITNTSCSFLDFGTHSGNNLLAPLQLSGQLPSWPNVIHPQILYFITDIAAIILSAISSTGYPPFW